MGNGGLTGDERTLFSVLPGTAVFEFSDAEGSGEENSGRPPLSPEHVGKVVSTCSVNVKDFLSYDSSFSGKTTVSSILKLSAAYTE